MMTETELTGDPDGRPHDEIDPKTKQQLAYVVLSEDERKKGFVEPLRMSYSHSKCGAVTTLGLSIAETYARNPKFYGSTFCIRCLTHYPVHEFVWKGTDQIVGTIGPKEDTKRE